MKTKFPAALCAAAFAFVPLTRAADAAPPDAVFFGGKIVTVDGAFRLADAMAIRGERIVALGAKDEVLRLAQPGRTQLHDLRGKVVLPGLIDSHVHPFAAWVEHDHPIPTMESVHDILDYFAARAKVVPPGRWLRLTQVFITRLREQRYPTRAELDRVAPEHPVFFGTGPDAVLNTLALRRSGIDRDFKVTDGGPGKMETDASGEPTGLLRNLTRFVKVETTERTPTGAEFRAAVKTLFADYQRNGLTAVGDRLSNDQLLALYQDLLAHDELGVRVAASYGLPTVGPMAGIFEVIDRVAQHPLRRESPRLRLIGTKILLDGGMLTGSAYLKQPWGVSRIYGIDDPAYRGVLNLPPDRLYAMVERVAQHGLQFTAHVQGDAAIDTLAAAYARLDRVQPVRPLRHSFTHASFMTPEAIREIARLGAVADLQPIWLYSDARTLVTQFGYDRLRHFIPLKSLFEAGAIVGGGTEHMQKIGAHRAINAYNPFLGMWVALTRRAKWYEGQLHPEEALTRRQALEFYTRNNAYLLFWEKEIGSLEAGKRADFIVVDRDPLECPIDDLKDTRVLETWMDGKRVFALDPASR